jgi:hypothetical protein
MYRMPARTSPCSASSVGGSAGLIEWSESAEARKESESARSAPGAENSCTTRPPRLGPATNENARLPFRSAFASR